MGYFIRILTPSTADVAFADLRDLLQQGTLVAASPVNSDEWSDFQILNSDGVWVAEVTRDVSEIGSLVNEEVAEFRESLEDAVPKSGALWVRDYLQGVKTIYAFQINTSEVGPSDWQLIYQVKEKLQERVGGILQADGEGFSNEAGDVVTWESPEGGTGIWSMALRENDVWITFKMKMDSKKNLAAFLKGRIPPGIKPS